MTEAKPVRRCPVCEHPSVLGINQAILNGKAFRAIARDWKIGSERSGKFIPDHKKVTRHAEGCMATSFQKVQETNLTAQGEAIQARMKYLDEQVDTAILDALKGEPVMMGDTPLLDDEGRPMMRRGIPHVRALLAAVREGRQNAALDETGGIAELRPAFEADPDQPVLGLRFDQPPAKQLRDRRQLKFLKSIVGHEIRPVGQD